MTLVLLIMVRPMLLLDNLWCLCIIYHELPLYVIACITIAICFAYWSFRLKKCILHMELIYSKSWAGMAPKEFSVSSFLQLYLNIYVTKLSDLMTWFAAINPMFSMMLCLVVIKSHIHLNLVQKLPVRNPQWVTDLLIYQPPCSLINAF